MAKDKPKEAPKDEPTSKPIEEVPSSGNIDDRMAALLKDHQRMGARTE